MTQKKLKVGQRVALTLDDEKIVGNIKIIKAEYLRLEGVRDFETNQLLAASNIFFTSNIRCINILEDVPETSPANHGEKRSKKKKLALPKDPQKVFGKNFIETSLKVAEKPVYLTRFDKTYNEAIRVISAQRTIGVVLENCEFGRSSKAPSILAIGTEQQVFIFDLIAFGKLSQELQGILFHPRPQKIVHHSASMIDCFNHKFNVLMRNFFDTMMAYKCVTNEKEVLTLEQLVLKLFNIEIGTKKAVDWEARPLSDEAKKFAAVKAMLLLELQLNLIHNHMLRQFYSVSTDAMMAMSTQTHLEPTLRLVGQRLTDESMHKRTDGNPWKILQGLKNMEI